MFLEGTLSPEGARPSFKKCNMFRPMPQHPPSIDAPAAYHDAANADHSG